MQVCEKLKAIRIDNDNTQKQVAEILSCSTKQVTRYEKGEQEMTLSKLKAFCMYYRVSADYILGLPKNMKWER